MFIALFNSLYKNSKVQFSFEFKTVTSRFFIVYYFRPPPQNRVISLRGVIFLRECTDLNQEQLEVISQ